MSIFTIEVSAQSKGKKKSKATKTTVAKKSAATPKEDTTTTILTSTSTNQAYGSANSRLRIADPMINAMNQRSAGANIRLGTSYVVGMPRGTYGIANGRILLRNTTATSPGTGYGSGAVGTGTAIQGMGTSEATIGVNGKSPYAGPWLWGDKQMNTRVLRRDSVRRQ